METVVVLGGSGFLGSHLVKKLHQQGVDVLSAGRLSHSSLGPLPPKVEFVQVDSLKEFQKVNGRRQILKLVCFTGPPGPQQTATWGQHRIEVFIKDFFSFLDYCAEIDVDTFYFASSGGTVYPDGGTRCHSESDPVKPRGAYGLTMVTIETQLEVMRSKGQLNSVVFRISNAYGPDQRTDTGQGFVTTSIKHALEGSPVQIWGSGKTVRDFIYVTDVAELMSRLITSERVPPVYNLGSGVGHSLNDVLLTIESSLGRPIERESRPAPLDMVDRSCLDISLLKAHLGPLRLLSLEEGISRTISGIRGV